MDIVARVVNFSLMIAMPFGLAIYLVRKFKTTWSLFGIGVITFILSQVVHIPFNTWVLTPAVNNWALDIQQGFDLAVYSLIYGLSAGVFEEITRYFGYKLWIRQNRTWKSALMYGAGHGGIESILLGGIALYAFIQAIALSNVDLSTVVAVDQIELVKAQLAAYWAAPWHLAILGAVERLATIIFHLSATVLVLQSFSRRNILWLVLTVLWHALVDATAVFASQTWNPYVTEAIILGMGILSLGVVLVLRSTDEENYGRHESAGETQSADEELQVKPNLISEESLDDSRYI